MSGRGSRVAGLFLIALAALALAVFVYVYFSGGGPLGRDYLSPAISAAALVIVIAAAVVRPRRR